MFKNYFNIAWRNIIHQRLTSLINIGCLSLAMTAVVIIVIWVQNELSFDNYHTGADRIYLLKNNWQFDKKTSWIEENSFFPLAASIENSVPEAETVTHMQKLRKDECTLVINGNRFREETAVKVDTNWFKVFTYHFKEGNAAIFCTNPLSIVLTESESKKLFQSIEVVGKQVQVDSTLFTVAGVIKDNPINSSFQFDVIFPFYNPANDLNDWLYLTSKTFVKLRSTADINAAQKKINAIVKKNSKADGSITSSFLPLKSMRFENDFEYSAFKHVNSRTVFIFSTLAFLILLISAINYINLCIARANARVKELSIRKINGAGRWDLFMQMMAESVVTSFISLLLTIFFVYIFLPFLKTFSNTNFVFDPRDTTIVFILSGTFLSIILLTGIYPAIFLSSLKSPGVIVRENVFGSKKFLIRKWLISGQFTFAVFMIIATLVIYKQLTFIQKQNIAYNRSQVFTVQVPSSAFSFRGEGSEARQESELTAIKEELLAKNEIQNVSRTDLSSIVNENYAISNGIDWDGKPADYQPPYISYSVDADMDSIMHFNLKEGRWFNEKITTDKNNVVLNETAVKKFDLKEPVAGKRFNNGIVIGVVKDFFHQSLHEKIGALVIRTGGALSGNFIIQARPGEAKKALQATETLWKKYFPEEIFDYSFADEDFAMLYKNDQNALTFTMVFSGLSILICCMGLLGMTVFTTQQRTKEIGIRKVLGASVTNVMLLLSADFLKLIAIAIIIASPIAWWIMHNWLQNYAYQIEISWWIFLAAGLLVIIISLVTVGFRTIKAAIANPVKSLRTE